MAHQTKSLRNITSALLFSSRSKTARAMQHARTTDCSCMQIVIAYTQGSNPGKPLPRGKETYILPDESSRPVVCPTGIVCEQLNTMSLLVLGILSMLAYLGALAIYRIYFHPNSHIPGPKLAAFTYWYQSYYDLWPHSGRFLWKTIELHEQYGPVVRIGPNEVQVNDPDFYSEMYSSGNRRREKSKLWFWMVGWSPFADAMAGLPGELLQVAKVIDIGPLADFK
jgi:hypothetical protein